MVPGTRNTVGVTCITMDTKMMIAVKPAEISAENDANAVDEIVTTSIARTAQMKKASYLLATRRTRRTQTKRTRRKRGRLQTPGTLICPTPTKLPPKKENTLLLPMDGTSAAPAVVVVAVLGAEHGTAAVECIMADDTALAEAALLWTSQA